MFGIESPDTNAGNYMFKDYLHLFASLILCLMVFGYFYGVFSSIKETTGSYSLASDYQFHWGKINSLCLPSFYNPNSCIRYPSLYHNLFFWENITEEQFFLFNAIFLLVAFPLAFFAFTRSFASVLAYFSIGFSFQTLIVGAFPSALLFFLLLLGLLALKDDSHLVSGILLGLAIAVHSKGLFIILGLIILYVVFTLLSAKIKTFYGNLQLVIGLKDVSFLTLPIDAIVKLTPLPFIYFAAKLNKPFYLAWLVLFGWFSLTDIRGFWYLGLIAPLVMPEYLAKFPKMRWPVYILLVVLVGFSLWYWPHNYDIVTNFALTQN